jgi:transglutaminase-like putative cysteine protease
MNRRRFTLVAVALWLGSMGWLVRREYLLPDTEVMLDAGLSIPPGATFFSVSLGDRQIGTASITLDTLVNGVRVVTRYDLDSPFAEGPTHVVSSTNAIYSRDLRLQRFARRSSGDFPPRVLEGVVDGDSLLTLRMGAPESAPDQTIRQPTGGQLSLPSAVPLRVALTGKLRVGSTIETRVIDPATLALRTESARIVADSVFVVPDSADLDPLTLRWVPATYDTVTAYRFDQTLFGLPMQTWVDQTGYVIYATTPLGFTLERSAFELVSENYRRSGRRTEGAPARSPSRGVTAVPASRRVVTQMTTLLDGGPPAQDSLAWAALDLDTPWQRNVADTVFTSSRSQFGEATLIVDYRIPYTSDDGGPQLNDGAYDGEDPRIGAQARRIIDGERQVVAAVHQLVSWVHEEIALVPATEPASAWYVLDKKAGDASGKAALFVALSRSVGIPARPVAGFVYHDGRFHYSAWAEVWLTAWAPVDPTLGIADGSHIRLTVGSLALPGSLPGLIGRLRPRMINIEEAP